MKISLVIVAAIVFSAGVFVGTSGSYLIVDQPRRADVIVVLAGETEQRPAHALQLLRGGYAPSLLLDVPADGLLYDRRVLTIAQSYVNSLPEARQISICPISGLSTKAEADNVKQCLVNVPAHHILLVTSDYHTRRALLIFRRKFSGVEVSAAAATDSLQFGKSWWRHRQWAKTNFDEWTRLLWWELVDRWR